MSTGRRPRRSSPDTILPTRRTRPLPTTLPCRTAVKPSTDEAIRRRIAGVTDRQEKRMIIAEEVRDASATRWRADVFSRKSAIATGSGVVHSARYEISNWGLDGRAVSAGDLDAPSELRFDASPGGMAPGGA